ncbi:hypothetical protein ABEV40_15035 [Geobacillus thermocatenulatus]|nr:hypothetical protein [Geobacillus thermocatenulatus]
MSYEKANELVKQYAGTGELKVNMKTLNP